MTETLALQQQQEGDHHPLTTADLSPEVEEVLIISTVPTDEMRADSMEQPVVLSDNCTSEENDASAAEGQPAEEEAFEKNLVTSVNWKQKDRDNDDSCSGEEKKEEDETPASVTSAPQAALKVEQVQPDKVSNDKDAPSTLEEDQKEDKSLDTTNKEVATESMVVAYAQTEEVANVGEDTNKEAVPEEDSPESMPSDEVAASCDSELITPEPVVVVEESDPVAEIVKEQQQEPATADAPLLVTADEPEKFELLADIEAVEEPSYATGEGKEEATVIVATEDIAPIEPMTIKTNETPESAEKAEEKPTNEEESASVIDAAEATRALEESKPVGTTTAAETVAPMGAGDAPVSVTDGKQELVVSEETTVVATEHVGDEKRPTESETVEDPVAVPKEDEPGADEKPAPESEIVEESVAAAKEDKPVADENPAPETETVEQPVAAVKDHEPMADEKPAAETESVEKPVAAAKEDEPVAEGKPAVETETVEEPVAAVEEDETVAEGKPVADSDTVEKPVAAAKEDETVVKEKLAAETEPTEPLEKTLAAAKEDETVAEEKTAAETEPLEEPTTVAIKEKPLVAEEEKKNDPEATIATSEVNADERAKTEDEAAPASGTDEENTELVMVAKLKVATEQFWDTTKQPVPEVTAGQSSGVVESESAVSPATRSVKVEEVEAAHEVVSQGEEPSTTPVAPTNEVMTMPSDEGRTVQGEPSQGRKDPIKVEEQLVATEDADKAEPAQPEGSLDGAADNMPRDLNVETDMCAKTESVAPSTYSTEMASPDPAHTPAETATASETVTAPVPQDTVPDDEGAAAGSTCKTTMDEVKIQKSARECCASTPTEEPKESAAAAVVATPELTLEEEVKIQKSARGCCASSTPAEEPEEIDSVVEPSALNPETDVRLQDSAACCVIL